MQPIYLDHNAATPLDPAVWEAMRPFAVGPAGNPASAHAAGRRARRALDDAREEVAALLDAAPDEVVFTSGATESNNLAVLGLCGDLPGHLLASPLEHPSVAEPVRHLERAGFALEHLPAGPDGSVAPDALAGRLRPETRLVAVMLANHETGAVQPVAELAGSLPAGVAFHCDAAQAVGKVAVSFRSLGVTALSGSAHKFFGPPGVGVLLLRRGAAFRPRVFGGHQQGGRRPGSEPVALAVGLAAALALAVGDLAARAERVVGLRRRLLSALRREAAPAFLNGPEEGGVPHTLNVSFPGAAADLLLMSLDLAGVCCSTGSACSSGSLLPSPVLRAMGVPDDRLRSAMRFSLAHTLTEEEIDEAARRIASAVGRLRGQN
jgi:cysteine desulfurase